MFEDDSLACNKDTFMDLDDSEALNLPIFYKYTSIPYTEKVEVPPSLSVWRGFSPLLRFITS